MGLLRLLKTMGWMSSEKSFIEEIMAGIVMTLGLYV